MIIKEKIYPFLIGLFCTFNFYIVYLDFLNTPRIFDVFSLIFIVFYFCSVLINGQIIIDVKHFILISLIILWLIHDLISNGAASLLVTGRWLTISVFIYFFNHYYLNNQKEVLFLKGFFYGLILNVLVILSQIYGYTNLLMKYGLVSSDPWLSYIGKIQRYSGLFEYSNAAAFVLGLGLPISIVLVDKYNQSKLYLLYGIILSLLSYVFTYTRTPIVILFVIFIIWVLSGDNKVIKKIYKLPIIVLIVSIITYFIMYKLSSRWTNINGIFYNLNLRLASIKMASKYIIKFPFGMGTDFKKEINYAVHNAYLQISLLAGFHFLLYLAFYIGVKFIGFIKYQKYYIWLILYLVMNFMFEEHLTNPVIVLILLWVLCGRRREKQIE